MARPSKLPEKKWAEIEKRLLQGEKAAALAREYKISPASISLRFSKRIETVKNVAGQIVETEKALSLLNISEQSQAFSLAADLISISKNLAGAARYGSMTAHRLAGIANHQIDQIDDANPLNAESVESLKGIAALTKLSNEAASTGLNLLAANKATVEKINNEKPPEELAPERPRVNRDEWLKLYGISE